MLGSYWAPHDVSMDAEARRQNGAGWLLGLQKLQEQRPGEKLEVIRSHAWEEQAQGPKTTRQDGAGRLVGVQKMQEQSPGPKLKIVTSHTLEEQPEEQVLNTLENRAQGISMALKACGKNATKRDGMHDQTTALVTASNELDGEVAALKNERDLISHSLSPACGETNRSNAMLQNETRDQPSVLSAANGETATLSTGKHDVSNTCSPAFGETIRLNNEPNEDIATSKDDKVDIPNTFLPARAETARLSSERNGETATCEDAKDGSSTTLSQGCSEIARLSNENDKLSKALSTAHSAIARLQAENRKLLTALEAARGDNARLSEEKDAISAQLFAALRESASISKQTAEVSKELSAMSAKPKASPKAHEADHSQVNQAEIRTKQQYKEMGVPVKVVNSDMARQETEEIVIKSEEEESEETAHLNGKHDIVKSSRDGLIEAVFQALDSSGKGTLGSNDLKKYALLSDLDRCDDTRLIEFQELCQYHGWDKDIGVRFSQFVILANDNSDEQLRDMVSKLEADVTF